MPELSLLASTVFVASCHGSSENVFVNYSQRAERQSARMSEINNVH